MLTLEKIPPVLWRMIMSEIRTGGGGLVDGDASTGRDFVGRDRSTYDSNVNINFDRASNWDAEREELTDRQRIRDLETYVFGDRHGLTIGVMRQMRSHLVWLVVLSLFQFAGVLLQAMLIWAILRGAL